MSAARAGMPARLAARVLGVLFLAGSSLAALTLALPQPAGANDVALGALVTCGCLVGAVIYRLADRAGHGPLRTAVALASTMITAGTYFSGVSPGPLQFIYLWVALYVAYFFTRAQAARQIAYVGLLFGALLIAGPRTSSPMSWWLVELGSLIVASALIMGMRERTELLIARLYESTRTDPQTRLSNRRAFRELLDVEVRRARRGQRNMTLLVGDLDHFRLLTDQIGHRGGRAALRRVARLLVEGKRKRDMAARVGETELALILPDTSQDAGFELAERLRCSLRDEFVEDPVPITLSFGVATYPEHGETAAALLRAADEALHAAESGGRDQTVRHSPVLRERQRSLNDSRGIEEERFVSVLLDLAEAVDLRFSGSARHSETVGRYAEMMALELGLTDERARRIRLAGMLHDIGKVGVPNSILHKQGPLTNDELAVIKRHPELGAQILEHPSLADVRAWVAAHHERPDGRGYPLGLSGDQLSLETRILAVADAYEAMTSDRPYRDSIGYASAREELCRCAGTQFDARVVEVFLRALRREDERIEALMLAGNAGS